MTKANSLPQAMGEPEPSFNASTRAVNRFDSHPPQDQVNEAFGALRQKWAPAEKFFTPPQRGWVVTSVMTQNTFTVGSFIGGGAFGSVYSGMDSWGNDVAIKVIKPHSTYELTRDAAIAEMQKLTMLRHPNITYVFDAFEYQDTFYIVTELCAWTLHPLLGWDGFNPYQWVRPIARCLLQAVQFLHNNHYVHQDIHFGNVFASFHRDEMSAEGRSVTFKLGDLGISKLAHEINAFNTILNPSMLAPEALQPGLFGPMDRRMDIYHCGLLFLQLFHKQQLAFSNEEILTAKPRLLAEALPPPYGVAISKALRRHVGQRTSSAQQFWFDLNALPTFGRI